jgi:hypothetical protein
VIALLIAMACEVPEPVPIGDANNYVFDGGLDIVTRPVAAQADLAIDWGEVTLDLQGHQVDPLVDVAMATLLAFRMPQEEVLEGLSNNDLDQSDVGLFVTRDVEPGETSAQLSEFGLLGNDIDVEEQFKPEVAEVWMLLIQSTTTPGIGTHQLMFLDVSEDHDADAVSFTNDDTLLDFVVDLDIDEPLAPVDKPSVMLDWSALTTNGLGGDFVSGEIDSMMLARYDEKPDELAEQFLDLELIAEDLYQVPLEGQTSYDTTEIEGFEGFTKDGTWVLALRCSTCTNPAPPFLTILDVR